MRKDITLGRRFSIFSLVAKHSNIFLPAFVVAIWSLIPVSSWAGSLKKHTFAFQIENGLVTNSERTIRVKEDGLVEILWETNKELEIHLHGYDLLLQLKPGEPSKMSFHAHTAGRYPVSTHGTGGHGALIYIEVHPR